MKKNYIILTIFLVCSISLTLGQDTDLDMKFAELKSKIRGSEGAQRLQLLDSLSGLTRFQSRYNYDSIVKETIDYATSLDSIRSSSKHTADYIFYLANRAGKPAEAVLVFENYVENRGITYQPDIDAQLYLNGADGFFFSGKTKASIPFYQKAGEYALQANDSLLLGKSKNYMSDAYADIGQFAQAGKLLEEAEMIFERTYDTLNLITTRNSRANLYSRIGFYKEAKLVRDDLIKLAIKRDDYRILQSTFYNMAIDNRKENNQKERIKNLKNALYYARKGDYESYQVRILISLLHGYSIVDSLKKAKDIINVINNHPKLPSDGGLDNYSLNEAFANYEFARGNYLKAINAGENLLQLDAVNDFGNSQELYKFLSNAYEKVGATQKSLDSYRKYSTIKDSIVNRQNVNSLAYYQTLYETEKRDSKISEQASKISLLDSENRINRQWMLFGGIGMLALFSIIYLLRSQKFARHKQQLQEQFSQDLINGQEKERTHISRELHDSIGQKLMLLSRSTKKLGSSDVENLANSTLEEVRNISRGLHPSNLERLGVTEAINALIYEINTNTDLFFTDEIHNIDDLLPKDWELHLYRIIQESLGNIVKHSQAKAVKIHIQKVHKKIELFISDNGCGFKVTPNQDNVSLGIKTLFERAKIINADMNIKSNIGKGTTIKMSVPITQS